MWKTLLGFNLYQSVPLDLLCKHAEKMKPLKQQIQEPQVTVSRSDFPPATCFFPRLNDQMVISELAVSPET